MRRQFGIMPGTLALASLAALAITPAVEDSDDRSQGDHSDRRKAAAKRGLQHVAAGPYQPESDKARFERTRTTPRST